MTTTSSAGGQSSNSTLQPTQILQIQQTSAGNVVQQSSQPQTIRKVGSTSNLTSLQQKVQVLNRPGIQIVQATPQRLTKTTSTLGSGTSGAGPSTGSPTPLQFQQVFQQQASKLAAQSQSQQLSQSQNASQQKASSKFF